MPLQRSRNHPLWTELNHYRFGCGKTVALVGTLCLLAPVVVLVNLAHVFGTTSRVCVVHYFHVLLPVSAMAILLALLYGVVAPAVFRSPLHPLWRPVAHGANVLIAVFVGSEIGTRLVVLVGSVIPAETIRFYAISNGLFFMTIIVVTGSIFDHVRCQARRAEERTERSKHAAIVARVHALQARINPHFLFNSLNTVAGLIEEDPKLAEQTLEKLAEIYRYVVQGSRKREVWLSEEIEVIKAYLEIQATRFEGRLDFSVDIPVDVDGYMIPPLTLQPLVENAVKHGVEQQRARGRIAVEARASAGRLLLVVEDNGPGPSGSEHQGSQTSLEDLRKRLRLLHGDAAQVDQKRGSLGGFRIEVTLPAQKGGGVA